MVWFAAAFELATLYVDVSVKHIVPNIQKLDQLAALAGGDNRMLAKAMATQIQDHLGYTQGGIETMANEVCSLPYLVLLSAGPSREHAQLLQELRCVCTKINTEMPRYGGCSGTSSGTASCARRRDSLPVRSRRLERERGTW